MALHKIVVGIDPTAGPELAATRAVELAEQTGAELVQLVLDDHPDETLLAAAAEQHADLIVTGAPRDESRLRRWLLGSVAEHVVRDATCSVLVTRDGDPDHGFERIVVGTDFSPAAETALARALELARPGATVDVIHCYQVPILSLAAAPDAAPVDGADTLRTELLADAHRRGDAALAAHAGAAVTLRFQLLEASARDALCEQAEQLHADLVVVGHHGRRGLSRVLLGSVAEAVVRHAPCSVLVAR